MKITRVDVQVVQPKGYVFRWSMNVPAVQKSVTIVYVRTDEGIDGTAVTSLPGSPREVADGVKFFIEPQVIGRDPWDRERIWQEMMVWGNRTISGKAASLVDIALWDIAGKAAGVPIYKLLGAYRESIPAYASTVSYPTLDDYVRVACECKQQGFKALKLHAFGTPKKDIEVCRAVRRAVGDEMELMLDPVNDYEYQDALKVGRALEELDFYWYEAAIKDEDVAGNAELCRALDIPVAVGESFTRGPWDYPKYLTAGAGDILRCIGDSVGGITAMRKIGALCESHNRKMEPHSYGNTITQAAHLHYMLSVKNCDFFEMPVPIGIFDYGMKDVITMDSDGMVHAPTKSGLGYELDLDLMEKYTVFRA